MENKVKVTKKQIFVEIEQTTIKPKAMIFSICISGSHRISSILCAFSEFGQVRDIFAEMLDINHAKRCVSILNAFDTSYIAPIDWKWRGKKYRYYSNDAIDMIYFNRTVDDLTSYVNK